ncbi:MAG: tRNA (adenosine(37)-N6)-dimethylallyltransferase MiaA [Armatimonadota bacterium]|jgi:tRNA dimethylallyltransferase
MADRIPLLCIVGPTATGKTRISIELARALGGEIVSADSMQIYRRMDIGTARPTATEREQATFHLIDFVEPDRPYSVQQYQGAAEAAIRSIHQRGALPILCGGTGLYVSAVLDHYVFPPGDGTEGTREQLEEDARRHGPEALHRRLQQIDPEAAARTSPRDVKRVVRALEVFALTGETISRAASVDPHSEMQYTVAVFGICMPRPGLYQRIEQRVDAMMEAGLLDEVAGLLREGYDRRLQAMQAIGYRQLAAHLAGETSLSDAIAAVKRDTRRYAKRQLTWLRRDERVRWTDVLEHGGAQKVADAIAAKWRDTLAQATERLCDTDGEG